MAAMWGIAVAGRIKANGENNRREVQRAGAHEQMVVFDSDRPIRCKTDFDAGSDRAAPAGFSYPVNGEAYSGCETLILVVGDGTAALHIPEHVIPGIADLAGEQAQRIDGGSVAQRGPIKQADIRSAQIGPIALCFQTEHHTAAHPTVADLGAAKLNAISPTVLRKKFFIIISRRLFSFRLDLEQVHARPLQRPNCVSIYFDSTENAVPQTIHSQTEVVCLIESFVHRFSNRATAQTSHGVNKKAGATPAFVISRSLARARISTLKISTLKISTWR